MSQKIIIVKLNSPEVDVSLFNQITLDSLLENEQLSKETVAKEWIDKLETIKEQKNEVVRNQRYEESAFLRDAERALLKRILNEHTPQGFETIWLLSQDGTNVYFSAPREVLWQLGYNERGEKMSKLDNWKSNTPQTKKK